MMLRKLAGIFPLLLLLIVVKTADAQSAVTPPFDIDRIRRATVFIMQTQIVANKPVITCISSGTIVSRDGLILTNAHSTVRGDDCTGEQIIIALSLRSDEPPVAKYQAEVVQFDAGLDIALLRIAREFDGRIINPDDLVLPFVELEDSDNVQLDETVWVVGYPGVSDDPVIELRSSILGFTAEPSGADRSWFKIGVNPDAALPDIPGVMSGGGAYNRNGRLVGIPTTAPVTRQATVSECRLIQDSNSDGLINQNDICIPLGGTINVLRPSNFARPLLQGASLGLQVEKISEIAARSVVTGEPKISKLFFASSVNNNAPATVISRLPAGNNSLYLFFDYENMTPETIYELRVSIRGVPNAIFSLSPVRWSGGERGLWHIGTTGQALPNGDYEFILFVNGLAAAPPARITVGGAAEQTPMFRSPVFALVENNQVFGDGYVLGTGNVANARFIYNNMQNGIPWIQVWYYNGVELRRFETEWTSPTPDGARTIALEAVSGLPPGRYRLELYIEGRLASLADFTIAGARDGAYPRVFSDTRFVIANSPEEAINARAVTNYTNAVERLYALFTWEQFAPGTQWRMRWSVDNTVFYDQVVPWVNPESGENYLVSLTGPEGVPDGTYRIELLVDNIVLSSQQIQIGIGQLPLDLFASADGVQLRGQVIDANTREGIPNLTIIIISDQYSVGEYQALQEQVYALAITDRNGRFQVERPLQFDAPYSMLIAADGYLPLPADGIRLTTDSPNPTEMMIYLTSD